MITLKVMMHDAIVSFSNAAHILVVRVGLSN